MSCCPKTYWCTSDGLIGVEADDDGVYTPPDGATGGPYATRAEGGIACPASVQCPECDEPFEIPSGAVGLYLTNLSGTPTFTLPAYTELPSTSVTETGFSFFYYDGAEFPDYTRVKTAGYGGSCTPEGGMTVTVQAVLAYSGGDWTWTPEDPADGWTPYSHWGFSKTFACGEQLDLSAPTYIGRIHYVNTGVDFTYDVYLGPPL